MKNPSTINEAIDHALQSRKALPEGKTFQGVKLDNPTLENAARDYLASLNGLFAYDDASQTAQKPPAQEMGNALFGGKTEVEYTPPQHVIDALAKGRLRYTNEIERAAEIIHDEMRGKVPNSKWGMEA